MQRQCQRGGLTGLHRDQKNTSIHPLHAQWKSRLGNSRCWEEGQEEGGEEGWDERRKEYCRRKIEMERGRKEERYSQ